MSETEWTPLHDFYAQDLDHDRLALGRRIALDYYAVYGGLLLTGSPFI